jgi:hypothetical protein
MGRSTQARFPKETRASQNNGSNTLSLIWRVSIILIESGMIYLVAQLILVVLYASKNPAYKVVAYPIIQIYVRFFSASSSFRRRKILTQIL